MASLFKNKVNKISNLVLEINKINGYIIMGTFQLINA